MLPLALLLACSTPEPETIVLRFEPGPDRPLLDGDDTGADTGGDTGGGDSGGADSGAGDSGGGDSGSTGDGWVAYEHDCAEGWSGIGNVYWYKFPVSVEGGTMPPRMELWAWYEPEFVAAWEDAAQEQLPAEFLVGDIQVLDERVAVECRRGFDVASGYEGWIIGGYTLVVEE